MPDVSYLAHSARPDQGIPAQEYGEHARAARDLARRYAEECGRYSGTYGQALVAAATLAGEFHDLGKLDDANQKGLASGAGGRLPVPHVDAGAAHLLRGDDQASKYAALVSYAHHRGLPSLPEEINRSRNWMRDPSAEQRAYTDAHLDEYLRRHRESVGIVDPPTSAPLQTNSLQLLWRLALSCQADADHGDTSRHYGKSSQSAPPPLRAQDRLAALDDYVSKLGDRDGDAPRARTRQAIYEACRRAETSPNLYACDASVGSGKTTAVMAHMLRTAGDHGLRRIFVVLPYTNIISEAVRAYRSALVLEGENPDEIVAEHHHRADYAKPDSRRFAMLWQAPIVVTTAVQFFETLASNMPADLRKLHRLPGSGVFLDEAHAALPPHLWPQAWLWLKCLSECWSCRFVLASGSLTRFWELADFHPEGAAPERVPELVSQDPRALTIDQEQERIIYKTMPAPFDLGGLVDWVGKQEGPRLVIMNTVQSAAVVAREMRNRCGGAAVEHLSTALTPVDREITLSRLRQRLDHGADSNWTLVATSCVEAGVNLSFRVGFRERAGLMNLVQIGGRINRGHEREGAEVWDFQITPDNMLRLHPKLTTAARVLGQLFKEGKVSPEFCTEALKREVRWKGGALSIELLRAESAADARGTDFPRVAELFRVIDGNTVTVVVGKKLQELLRSGKWCGRDEMQKQSVQIWGWRVGDLGLEEFSKFPGLYGWPCPYDGFLGYMAGLLQVIEFGSGRRTVI